jgi:hypothetical protein
MITFLSILPVELQQLASLSNTNNTSPRLTASFNQTQAEVGDTWQIPMNTENTPYLNEGDMTVTFAAIQDLKVAAGTYKVFRMDFSENAQEQIPSVTGFTSIQQEKMQMQISGQSYLEYGTCKQIQSNLQLNMTTQMGNNLSYRTVVSYTCTLMQDSQP